MSCPNSETLSKNLQNQGFSPFCVTKTCTYVIVIGVRVHLGMFFVKINKIKCKCSLKHEKHYFCAYPLKSTDWVAITPPPSTFDERHDPVEGDTSDFVMAI